MLREIPRLLLRAGALVLALSALLGLAYPALIAAVGGFAFPREARGSLIVRGERLIGSELLGQPFASPGRFHGRPSETSAVPYDGARSAASNLGPLSPSLSERVAARAAALRSANRGQTAPIPSDLLLASASGLDPHISLEAAAWQLPRVAAHVGLPPERIAELVHRCTESRSWGLLGEPRVNVLRLNLLLDDAGR